VMCRAAAAAALTRPSRSGQCPLPKRVCQPDGTVSGPRGRASRAYQVATARSSTNCLSAETHVTNPRTQVQVPRSQVVLPVASTDPKMIYQALRSAPVDRRSQTWEIISHDLTAFDRTSRSTRHAINPRITGRSLQQHLLDGRVAP